MLNTVILAAGQGSRLRPLTADVPKCMVEICGKPMLQHQLDVLRSLSENNIHIVTGYLSENIAPIGLKMFHNAEYLNTNMVHSLFCAEELFYTETDLLIAYGDIVYEKHVVTKLLESDAPITISVDKDWLKLWLARMDNPLMDAESLKLDYVNKVIEIGKKASNLEEIQGQYMGLIKIKGAHLKELKRVWETIKTNPPVDFPDVKNTYMTDFLQILINMGWDVKASLVQGGWLEIDTLSDLQIDVTKFWHPSKC